MSFVFEPIDAAWWWAQAATTWFLVGLIWVVQIVIYPQMARMVSDGFPAWHRTYTQRIGWVVAPMMVLESALASWWVFSSPDNGLAWVGAGLVMIVWASTFALQIPLHRRLAEGWDEPTIDRLVATNWVRTVAWSLRGMLFLDLIAT
ncbi:hypothetical protein N9023_01850 [Opitutaceae bacterium]|nr:hypothetical protein [Opitutaceae bacterium]MDB4473722.1 hypothetical protein [Opitutaceae bacterium]